MAEKLRRAAFFDKDGTLLDNVPYNVDCRRITFATGALDAARALQDAGYLIVVVTNQSGVAMGLFDYEAVLTVENFLCRRLADAGVSLAGFYFCPHHPRGTVERYAIRCRCRKPQAGMLVQAATELRLDLSRSWLMGDILDDVEAGRRAGCRTILVDSGGETEWRNSPAARPDFQVADLSEAAERILACDALDLGSNLRLRSAEHA